jgi:signal transduction histidine kinase
MQLVAKLKVRRFKLRSILLAVSLVVLVLPLGGIYFLRIYENELVKQTELELISQAALISAVYRREILILTADGPRQDYGIKTSPPPMLDDYYRPIKAALNLADSQIRPRPEEPQKTDLRADPAAMEAGRRLSPMLLDAQRTTLSGVRILDHQGIAVGGRADSGLSFAHLEEVQRARSGVYTSSIRERTIHRPTRAFASISRGTGIRVFVAFPIRDDDRLLGVILLSRTPQSILEHLYDQKERVLVLAGVVLLLAVALAVLTSYTIAQPLHALIQQTKQFASGDKKSIEPLRRPITEEVALLSESFAEMARSLDYRAQYIRNFAAHVSHEFKTPLTAIQGAVELLQEHLDDMPPERRARFLSNIAQDADRLKRLVDRLLEMARADVIDPTGGQTDLEPIIAKLRERYKDQGVAVSFAGVGVSAAAVPPEILETVFANLLDNSRQNGAKQVDIKAARSNGYLSIAVADNGQGISAANSDKIFTPFFTTHREQGGTGLGLGIVRSLLKAYDGNIWLETSSNGATFRMTVPEMRARS